MRTIKYVSLFLACVVMAFTVKPVVHYLDAKYGMWGWGAGMLAFVGVIVGLIWIGNKLQKSGVS